MITSEQTPKNLAFGLGEISHAITATEELGLMPRRWNIRAYGMAHQAMYERLRSFQTSIDAYSTEQDMTVTPLVVPVLSDRLSISSLLTRLARMSHRDLGQHTGVLDRYGYESVNSTYTHNEDQFGDRFVAKGITFRIMGLLESKHDPNDEKSLLFRDMTREQQLAEADSTQAYFSLQEKSLRLGLCNPAAYIMRKAVELVANDDSSLDIHGTSTVFPHMNPVEVKPHVAALPTMYGMDGVVRSGVSRLDNPADGSGVRRVMARHATT